MPGNLLKKCVSIFLPLPLIRGDFRSQLFYLLKKFKRLVFACVGRGCFVGHICVGLIFLYCTLGWGGGQSCARWCLVREVVKGFLFDSSTRSRFFRDGWGRSWFGRWWGIGCWRCGSCGRRGYRCTDGGKGRWGCAGPGGRSGGSWDRGGEGGV